MDTQAELQRKMTDHLENLAYDINNNVSAAERKELDQAMEIMRDLIATAARNLSIKLEAKNVKAT